MPVNRHIFVKSPACRNMVNNNVTYHITTNGIISAGYVSFTTTETHVTDHYVMGINPYRFPSNTYTITWRCLSCYSNIWCTNNQWCFQSDDTSNIKNNDSCP